MKYLIYIVSIIVLIGIQVGLFSELRFFSAVPNLSLLLVIGFCLQREDTDAFFIAILSGFFLDYNSGLLLGSFASVFFIVALILHMVLHSLVVFEVSIKYLVSITIGVTIFVQVYIWLIHMVGFHYGWSSLYVDPYVLKTPLFATIFYNCLLAYPMYLAATWLKNLTLLVSGRKHRIY